MKEVLSTEEIHLFEFRHELPEELLRLVREEFDALCQIRERLPGDLAFEGDGELIQN